MKLQHLKRAFLVLTLSMFAVGLATSVDAKPKKHGTPALVIYYPSGCALFDGDGNVVSSASYQVVVTWSETGIATMSCHAEGLANSTGQAVYYDAYNNPNGELTACITTAVPGKVYSTYDVHETISASGNANLKCHFEDVN